MRNMKKALSALLLVAALASTALAAPKTVRLVLLRHGESVWNLEKRFTGWSDIKLTRKGVKQARLQYEVLQTIEHEGQRFSLLKIQLLTGRTHQIRVQFASRKMPLVGDRRYGCHIPADHIQLCAARLSFSHPVTGEEMRFSYDPTDEFYRLFKP